MRGRISSVRTSAAGSWDSALAAASSSAVEEACPARAGAARWRIWAPILLRALALGIALLGLAGIGSVASRAPEPPTPALARAGLELGTLPGGALSMLVAGAAAQVSSTPHGAANAPLGPASMPREAVSTPPGAAAPAAAESSASLGAASTPPGAVAASPGVSSAPPGAASTEAARPPAASRTPAGAASPGVLGPASNEHGSAPCPEVTAARAQGWQHSPAGELRVALNQADAAELRRLPGVGAKRAEAIVQLRARLGRFRRPNELLRIKGIGPRTLERMLPHLVLD